ncbi:WD-repeat protein [Aspergillus terreus]|uniref:WD-repeat protein n=1 Tax=Aspergillus terreus TaxID=33178 RepID=A0A5M3YZ42_ASPTE|nr:hypothetical protein ATETN484_0004072600 [Aspergillus terreus]GFF13794.1 WD-repeat protein [Aspergillus terreus]
MTFRTHHDYTVAWICALPLEMAAAKTMLDEIHDPLPQPPTDQNTYTLGKVSGHNVVIACLQSGIYGVTSAAIALAHFLPTFPSVKFGLLVGVAGGVPSATNDIRLGDVVVSKPTGSSGGVIQYDLGKALVGGRFQPTGFLNKPPQLLLTAMAQVECNNMIRRTSLIRVISNALDKNRSMKSYFPRPNHDHLFRATYSHQDGSSDCSSCNQDHIVARAPRSTEEPHVHYGLIASGDQVMDDPQKRDAIAQQLDVLCFETEAAGVMNQLPCLVICGICNYCDSHKDEKWQGYAALTAAAYARELLSVVPVHQGNRVLTELSWHQKKELEEREAFLHWIPTDDYDQMYEALLEKRSPGTCKWIIETKAFKTWRQRTSSSLLWCHGKPGIGKSVLLAYLTKLFREQYCTSTDVGIIFSCYDHNRQDLAEPSRMVSAMLKQLYRQKGSIPQEHFRFKRISLRPSLANLCDIFTSYTSSFGKVFLLVDALDECPFEARYHMIRFLFHILQHVPDIKILVMCRKELDIQEAFQEHPSLVIGKKDVTHDIKTYITTEVRRLRRGYHGKKLYIKSDFLEAEVIENLIANADGMFRWANLQLEHIRVASKARNDAVVRSALSDTPRGLDPAYHRIISHIEDQPAYMKNLGVRALRCVLYANHPLNSDALRDAVSTPEDHGELDPAPLDVILDACANSIITEEDGTVRLIHGSLREFFLTQSSSGSGSILHQLQDSPTRDTASATAPLSHLRDSILEEGHAACPEDLYPHIKLHKFLWHCACFFDNHMEAVRQSIPFIEELMAALLLQSPLVLVFPYGISDYFMSG